MGFIIVIETPTQTPSEIWFPLYRPQGSPREPPIERQKRIPEFILSILCLQTGRNNRDGSGKNRIPAELTLGAVAQSGLAGADIVLYGTRLV